MSSCDVPMARVSVKFAGLSIFEQGNLNNENRWFC